MFELHRRALVASLCVGAVVCSAPACSVVLDPDRHQGGSTPAACIADGGMGRCGDGTVVSGEECDDGNADDGDGCSKSCIVEDQGGGGETCGDAAMLRLVPTLRGTCGLSARATGDLSAAVANINEATCGPAASARDVVYAFTLESASTVTIELDVTSGSYDPYVSVRRDPCLLTESEIACVDDQGLAAGEVAMLPLLEPGAYYVLIEAFDALGGGYALRVSAP